MATDPVSDEPTVEPLTSAAKVSQKVEWIISTGRMPAIEGSYERRRAIGFLDDYASHPDSSERVRERAKTAIDELEQ